jgi:hypothetical protein
VRLNFVAIVTALDALATGNVKHAKAKRYEELPVNETQLLYIAIRNANVITGAGVRPFVADIGIVGNRRVRVTAGGREVAIATSIDDFGDLRTMGALREIDATGMLAVPDRDYKEGAVIDAPDWRVKTENTLAVGQPARVALLKAVDGNKYRVELVLR